MSEPRADQTERVPILEEQARIDKREVSTGRVRVKLRTETTRELVRSDLTSRTVEVSRVPVGREIDTIPAIRREGDVTIVPVVEEVLVVEKRLVLKEELHLRDVETIETVEEPVELRRQRAEIEREAG